MSLPNLTYIDKYIQDGQNSSISLKNLYDTYLVSTKNDNSHIFRVPFYDFFTEHKSELSKLIEYYQCPEYMFYKPKLLSLDLYKTTELWLSILRLNGMRNITEFHQPFIKIYNPAGLERLINIFFKRSGVK